MIQINQIAAFNATRHFQE